MKFSVSAAPLVSPQHQLRVRHARRFRKLGTVDQVAAIARKRGSVARFKLVRARLGILTGKASYPDHPLSTAQRQHQAHLQQDFELVRDGGRVAVIITLGTIAALQQKSFAACRLRQLRAQRMDFP